MADTVHYRMERMVDELDDLERRGIFTRREIAEIVKQRRKFEYRLKRHSPLKEDYLAYIDYETSLDSLRRLRKRSVVRVLREQGTNDKNITKTSISDHAGTTRIIEIYRIAVARFKGDIQLWFKYLEFCRKRKNGRMKKALAQLIRFHPRVPGVWIYAAAWEFDTNLNVAAARALMQNGLRECPTSEDLWVEYARMELTYLNKLKTRKVLLGEEKRGDDVDMPLEEEKEDDLFGEKGLGIVRAIYGGAVEAIPSSIDLRRRFLEILKGMEVQGSEDLRKEIMSDMKRGFSSDPEYWDWLARLEMDVDKSIPVMSEDAIFPQLQKAIQVYEEAVQVVPSPEMFTLYTKFLMDAITPRNGEPEDAELVSSTEDCIQHISTVYETAEKMECMSEELACQYVSFYMQLGRLDDARKLAEKFCTGKFLDSVQLWLLRASVEIRFFTCSIPAVSKTDLRSIFEILSSVLTKVSVSAAGGLWQMALKFFSAQKHYFDKLVEMSVISVAKDSGGDDGFSLPSAVVNFVLQRDGLLCAREMYKRFLALPRPGLVLYRDCIELEQNLASVGDKDCLVNARKLYESALTTYEQNVSLWQNYHAMEIKLGMSETASAIYWRARKTLRNFTAFIVSADSL